jgi:single-stranded-DNA-specific exonuclease
LGARLLATDDEMEAARIAVLLDKLNRERKAIEARMLEEAVANAERLVEADADLPLLLIAGEGWHKGVVGLVASRLTERLRRPACVIAWEETGSAPARLDRSTASISARRYGRPSMQATSSRVAGTPWRPA